MTKDFKVLLASIITYFVAFAFVIFSMIYFGLNELSYKMSIFILIGLAILELGFIATRLALNKEYKLRQFIVGLYSALAIYAIILYYVEKYVSSYDKLIVMYWLLYFLGIIIIVVVFLLLNKFIKPKEMTLNDYIKRQK